MAAPEAVAVRAARLNLALEGVGVHHHGQGLRRLVALGPARNAPQDVLGFLEAALLDKPPGTLGHEETRYEQGHRPDPLHREGDAVGPLVILIQQTPDHTRAYELPDREAHVDVSCQVGAQCQRQDFGRIRGANRGEDAPWNPVVEVNQTVVKTEV